VALRPKAWDKPWVRPPQSFAKRRNDNDAGVLEVAAAAVAVETLMVEVVVLEEEVLVVVAFNAEEGLVSDADEVSGMDAVVVVAALEEEAEVQHHRVEGLLLLTVSMDRGNAS